MAINNPISTERVYKSQLHTRLSGLGAVYKADKSSDIAHVYHSPSRQQWIKVVGESPTVCALGFYTACPCSKTK